MDCLLIADNHNGDVFRIDVLLCHSLDVFLRHGQYVLDVAVEVFIREAIVQHLTKLAGDPYHAGFGYLAKLLGAYIVPGIIAYGFVGVFFLKRSRHLDSQEEDLAYKDKLGDVILRAARVYLFIMALVFLGEGFKPIIIKYVSKMPSEALFWVNTISAILDNATLTAAEIGPALSLLQIKGALMGLLIAGGMLIPGNIPNIIAAGKLKIKSKEWAQVGVPIGIVTMFVYFLILYLPHYF